MKTNFEMTRELGGFAPTPKFLEAFAELVRADEREENAKVCEGMEENDPLRRYEYRRAVLNCADTIRAGGQA